MCSIRQDLLHKIITRGLTDKTAVPTGKPVANRQTKKGAEKFSPLIISVVNSGLEIHALELCNYLVNLLLCELVVLAAELTEA